MSATTRKKFKFNVTPTDRQLWAIGMVVVQWSLVEEMVKVFVHSFTNQDDPNDVVRKLFDRTRSMQKRIDRWEELTKQHIRQEWQQPMLRLINETRQIQDLRDKIVHGTWADKENATVINPEAHGPFSWGSPGHAFSWKLNFGDILDVALRIDRHHAGMMDLVLRANGTQGEGESFTLGSALRRIQNAPVGGP